ncbi:MAG: hypothetical protein UV38_C0002G0299 [candidate division TM6 bacterium GW2011_GWE2_42_60]|nr:MAG: hypothetical protein UV38_C0002G0299 [candidate division TM6 bacterium GW2011_GWE2_42_60]HBY05949.1 hypothetical protein [Candidatus Dependentiae bacterium]
MNKIVLALLYGLGFALADWLIMLPNKFESIEQKHIATASASVQAFVIGFLISLVALPLNPILTGALVGFLISLPAAIIVHMYPQILGNGIIGGAIIGAILMLVG